MKNFVTFVAGITVATAGVVFAQEILTPVSTSTPDFAAVANKNARAETQADMQIYFLQQIVRRLDKIEKKL